MAYRLVLQPIHTTKSSVHIDDKTRLITSFGIFKRATAENSIYLLKEGIKFFGKPKSVMTDHGSQYYANKADSKQESTQIRLVLNTLRIKHYLARINRSQTNGKVERFFRTYKEEYARGTFSNLKDFIKHYNEKKLI